MTHVDSHPPGTFCWIELATTDQSAAKKFYSALFGWEPNDAPVGPDEFYTTFQLEGRSAAAGFTIRPDERAKGIPPHWGVYVEVANADATEAKAKQLGANIVCSAFDVMDFGRMAVFQDPTGAHLAVWRSKTHHGTRIAHVPGTLCWADLSTPDPKRASEFYSALFGWEFMLDPKDKSGYLHIKNGEHFIGGVPPASVRQPGVPPHWLAYFEVSDVDATANNAKKMGAKLCFDPMTLEGVGRFAVISDPQGAAFAIFKSAR
jgi:uncharacterized protein